jgi:hypothetical protein
LLKDYPAVVVYSIMHRLTKDALKRKQKLEAKRLKVSYASLSHKHQDGHSSDTNDTLSDSTHPHADVDNYLKDSADSSEPNELGSLNSLQEEVCSCCMTQAERFQR